MSFASFAVLVSNGGVAAYREAVRTGISLFRTRSAANLRRMRPPKKSETLEVRIPFTTKEAFMARCRAEGRSASAAVRGFIEGEVGGRRRRQRLIGRLAAGALLAAAAGAVAAPTLAHTNRTAEFRRLDTNHDGVITLQEFRAR